MLGSQGRRGTQKRQCLQRPQGIVCVVRAKRKPETWLVTGTKSQDSSDKETFLLGNEGDP